MTDLTKEILVHTLIFVWLYVQSAILTNNNSKSLSMWQRTREKEKSTIDTITYISVFIHVC